MTDKYDNDQDKQTEIDDFLSRFDEITNEFDKRTNRLPSIDSMDVSVEKVPIPEDLPFENIPVKETSPTAERPEVPKTPPASSKANRRDRFSKSKSKAELALSAGKDKLSSMKDKIFDTKDPCTEETNGGGAIMGTKKKRSRNKKYRLNKKQFLKFVLGFFIILGIIGVVTLASIVITAPAVTSENIYSLLSENSVLYDDQGEVVDSLLTSEGRRTNVSYTDLPKHLTDAFISIEDKTFKEHNGFNFIRIMGAIKESIFDGGSISGTSTITQQLARNLYLAETKSIHSMTRKVKEAYYTVLLEKHLSKEQILEAYLNTIYLGYTSYGVQAASQSYFSKDVSQLTLAECAALASLPQAPDRTALIKKFSPDQIDPADPNILYTGSDMVYVYNDAFVDRQHLVLQFMKEQGKITEAEYNEAMAYDLRASIVPGEDTISEKTSYFVDYVIDDVIEDLMSEKNLSKDEATSLVYNSGLHIHTTMNANMQSIAETEFSNNANFPDVTNLNKDGAGNILNSTGNIMLYSYNSYFNDDGSFTLRPDEYTVDSNGNVIIYKGNRLNVYKTEVDGQTDWSLEFKDMYTQESGTFYGIKGGVITVPAEFKEKNNDGNLVISKKFMNEYPDTFTFNDNGLTIGAGHYVLRQKTVQPQSAIVILDYHNGGIKAMVGGRNTQGAKLFNRADEPRQPGSSMKPIGAYGPALQATADELAGKGTAVSDKSQVYGSYWTAASAINDAPLKVNGKNWPKNWYSGYKGLMSMRHAIEQSVNTCAVKVFNDVGEKRSIEFAKSLGVTSIIEDGPVNDCNAAAMALGGMTYGVSPLEMSAAYGVFAHGGKYTEPTSYTKITNKRGEVILESTPHPEQVMDEGAAFIMTDMLRSAVNAKMAGDANIGSQPVAGKTGTTTDNYDAWFVGYTPQYAAAVWIGNDVNIELTEGSSAATRIWQRIMRKAHVGLPAGSFKRPDTVISATVDSFTGMLPSTGKTRTEYFIKGSAPTSVFTGRYPSGV
ncbi:MAG: transglycosylase domain-containing protein, partial [Anaerovorax sp.]